MHVRPVGAGELDIFVEAAGSPAHHHEVRQYLERMFAAGSMRPEWCFVAEAEGGRPVGRVAFWTLPGMDEPFALVLLDMPDDDPTGVGAGLLADVLDRARALGAEEIEHVIDAPPMTPQFQEGRGRRISLLEDAGFAFRRETSRYEWVGTEKPPARGSRLSFRSLEETGEEAFVDAMVRVSEGTLDREIHEERERLGPRPAARDFFDDARRVQHDPSWWRLAYAPDGELAGLVIPAEPPGFLTIFYIGVVPEMRGHGYVDDLLAAGTRTLLDARTEGEAGKPLLTDTDISNAPMAAAFERAGWTQFASRREYVLDLTL